MWQNYQTTIHLQECVYNEKKTDKSIFGWIIDLLLTYIYSHKKYIDDQCSDMITVSKRRTYNVDWLVSFKSMVCF